MHRAAASISLRASSSGGGGAGGRSRWAGVAEGWASVGLATRATNYGQEIGRDAYSISARFTNVAELKDRAPVKIGGVAVGWLAFVLLKKTDRDRAVVTA